MSTEEKFNKRDHIMGRVIKYNPNKGVNNLQFVASIFIDKEKGEYQHLYIVSDDQIESGDRYIIEGSDIIHRCWYKGWNEAWGWPEGNRNKLIRTTHPGLDVKLIDQEEIQWYIDFLKKNS